MTKIPYVTYNFCNSPSSGILRMFHLVVSKISSYHFWLSMVVCVNKEFSEKCNIPNVCVIPAFL